VSWYSEGLRAGRPGFHSLHGKVFFLFSTASKPALVPTQPPIQWVLADFPPGEKQLGCEANLSPASNAERSRIVDLYLHFPTGLFFIFFNSGL
jgi:hypothetical protein